MRHLRRELLPFAHSATLGDGTSGSPSLAVLHERLELVLRANRSYLKLAAALGAVLYVAAGLVVAKLDDPWVVVATLAILALTTPAMIILMRGLWRERLATEILLALADAFEGDALRVIVDTFVRWIR